MEHYKISKLLNNSTVSKFMTKKWIKLNDLLCVQYSVNKNIRCKTPMQRLDLCGYSDTYIVVKGTIDLIATAANANDRAEKDVGIKNETPFMLCI